MWRLLDVHLWQEILQLQNKLQRLQNRAVRIITKRGYDNRSVDMLNELQLPNLNVRRHNQLCNLMYKVNSSEVPDYLVDLFTSLVPRRFGLLRRCVGTRGLTRVGEIRKISVKISTRATQRPRSVIAANQSAWVRGCWSV